MQVYFIHARTNRLLKKSIRGLFQHAKQKAATPAPPCARDAQGGASVAGGRMPRATGIRASCTAWFLLCFIFQTLRVFEKSAGSGFSRQPRRGLAQGCVKQKWRYLQHYAVPASCASQGRPSVAGPLGGRKVHRTFLLIRLAPIPRRAGSPSAVP